ncbi:MAG: hypothetical protein Kow00114_24650 [Kiloniellaceae bacterium]
MPYLDISPRPHGGSLHCGPGSAARRGGLAAVLKGAALAAGLLAALPALAPAALAQAQSPVPVQPQAPQGQPPQTPAQGSPDQVFGDWTRRCTPNPPPQASPPKPGEQEVCFLIQQVMDRNTQNPILKVTVGFFGPQRQAGAVVAMPLGVPLVQGLRISVDGAELRQVPFQVCRRDGCTAFVPLDAAAIGTLKAGAQALATVDSGQGDGISLPVSLKGFTAGYGAIE